MNRLTAIYRVESAQVRLSCARTPEVRAYAERVLKARQKILAAHQRAARVNGI